MADSLWDTDEFARRYDEIVRGPYPFHKRAARLLVDFAAPQPGQDVLDLGAGTGLVAEGVLAYQLGRLLLADSSAEMLKISEQHLSPAAPDGVQLAFIACDAAELTVHVNSDSVDLVVASYAFGWFSDPQKILHQIARVLKPEGVLVFDVPPPPEPEPQFLAAAPVYQVFSRNIAALLNDLLDYNPPKSRRRKTPPDFNAYVDMARAAGFQLVDTLRLDVPYAVEEVEAAWRYGWWISRAANPALAKLRAEDVEVVAEEAIERTRASDEYKAWLDAGGTLWETYAALKVRKG